MKKQMTLAQAIKTLDQLIGRRAGWNRAYQATNMKGCPLYVAQIDHHAVPNCRVVLTDGTPGNDFRDSCTSVFRSVREISEAAKFGLAEAVIAAATDEELEAALASA